MSEYIWPKPSSFPDWSDLHNLSVGVSRNKIYDRQEWTDHHGRIHVMIDEENDKIMTDEEYQKYKNDRYEATLAARQKEMDDYWRKRTC